MFDKLMHKTFKYLFGSSLFTVKPVSLDPYIKEIIKQNATSVQFLKLSCDIIFHQTGDTKFVKNQYMKIKKIIESTFSITYKVTDLVYSILRIFIRTIMINAILTI